MNSESLPKRHFTKGKRNLVGFRLPAQLKNEIEQLANDLGWTITDIVQTALDQYVHGERIKQNSKKIDLKK